MCDLCRILLVAHNYVRVNYELNTHTNKHQEARVRHHHVSTTEHLMIVHKALHRQELLNVLAIFRRAQDPSNFHITCASVLHQNNSPPPLPHVSHLFSLAHLALPSSPACLTCSFLFHLPLFSLNIPFLYSLSLLP